MKNDLINKDLNKIKYDEVDKLMEEFSFVLLSNLYDVKDKENLNKAINNTNIKFDRANLDLDLDNNFILKIDNFKIFKDSYKNHFMDLRANKLNQIKEDNPNLYTSFINSIENNLTDSLLILNKFKNLTTILKNKNLAYKNLEFKNLD